MRTQFHFKPVFFKSHTISSGKHLNEFFLEKSFSKFCFFGVNITKEDPFFKTSPLLIQTLTPHDLKAY